MSSVKALSVRLRGGTWGEEQNSKEEQKVGSQELEGMNASGREWPAGAGRKGPRVH